MRHRRDLRRNLLPHGDLYLSVWYSRFGADRLWLRPKAHEVREPRIEHSGRLKGAPIVSPGMFRLPGLRRACARR